MENRRRDFPLFIVQYDNKWKTRPSVWFDMKENCPLNYTVIPRIIMYTDKQSFELNVVRLFREAGGLERESELALGADPPDIITRIGERTIGIEVRRLYADEGRRGGSADRRRFGVCSEIVKRAEELHGQITDRFFHINVHFNKTHIIHDKRIPVVAEMLVGLISQRYFEVGELFSLRSEELWGPAWPEEVRYVSGMLLEGDRPPFWGLSDSSWVGETTFDLVQAALDAKERRICAFAEGVDEAWLLLVCDGSVGASLLQLHSGIEKELYRSSCNRAFIMDYSGRMFAELVVSA